MKLGIMQPYFFPNLGHFDLINRVDKWVVFDIVQYTPRSWINRNRILHPEDGWQYINMPVIKSKEGNKIYNAKISDIESSKSRVFGQLGHYKRNAPHYRRIFNLVGDIFDLYDSDSLVEFNVLSLKMICEYLGVEFDYEICSEMNYSLPKIENPGEWALEISDFLGAKEYINPVGGRDIFSPKKFKERNISLKFVAENTFSYECGGRLFEPGLSIIDVLMWNSIDDVKKKLDGMSNSWG